MTAYRQTGRCHCGAVRLTLNRPTATVRVCWCRDCQHYAPNGSTNAVVSADALEVSGETAVYRSTTDSGHTVQRVFCPQCGSLLFARSSGRPDLLSLRVGNMDDPSAFPPAANIWTASAPQWACLDATLPRSEQG